MKICRKELSGRGGYFDLDGLKQEIKKLEKIMSQPDFWQDQNQAKTISWQAQNLKTEVAEWESLEKEIGDLLDLANEVAKSDDLTLQKELEKNFSAATDKFKRLEILVLFSGQYDKNSCIISIHAGTGGTEAQDWAEMLLRMYLRYCERKGFITKIIDQTRGQEAGVKSVSVEVNGLYAYGNLKSEAGVHRLVRISPFDAEKMRHTSFALVEVVPELDDDSTIQINDKDLKIETMRASGHGGQGVNRTDSAVRITHLPTGIVVKCQNERSQVQNKQLALKHLKAKLAKLQEEEKGKEMAKIRGEVLSADWGNQIRSYVLQPYRLVKDHRTEFETSDTDAVLDGKIDSFVESYLRWKK